MKKYLYISTVLALSFFSVFVFADGGMVIWPPDVLLNQSAQNAIVAWNGEEEIIILSNDIESDATATVLRMIPLPSEPTEIKEGSFESFEKLVEIMEEKLEAVRSGWQTFGEGTEPPAAGIEITFHEKIGAHDVTVVKVSHLDYFLEWIKDFAAEKGLAEKEISPEFKEGLKSYLKRDIKYFVFDVIDAEEEKESIKPLIYRFNSDYLFYPLLITGVSEVGASQARIDLFIIAPKGVKLPEIPYSYYVHSWFSDYGYPVQLSREELNRVSEDLAGLFESGAQASKASLYGSFNQIKRDLIIFPTRLWAEDLSLGSYGKGVEALQKILINEGVWDSEAGATGYFGPITKNALAKFQEKYKQDILSPISLEAGTGYFGGKTRDYLEKLSIEVEEVGKEIKWDRNLTIGMRGDDVSALQEIFISERVWERTDIGSTGYFGQITKEALIRFQEKYFSEVLEPLGLDKGTGYLGSSTRNFLNERY